MIQQLEKGDVLYITTPNGKKYDISVFNDGFEEKLVMEEVKE